MDTSHAEMVTIDSEMDIHYAEKVTTDSEMDIHYAEKVTCNSAKDTYHAEKVTMDSAKDKCYAEKVTRNSEKDNKMPPSERTIRKQQHRALLERQMAERTLALPDKKFNVIYADPPWRFEPYSRETGMDRDAANHYNVMSLSRLHVMSADIERISAPDCVLFMWGTTPMTPEAFEVMKAWGFDYKSHFIWRKDKIGLGYWNRNRHEILLVGTRGRVIAPAPGTQRDSVIDAPRGEHSAKPEVFYELIEHYYPTVPKIELFARRRREGWDAWGAEAPDDEAQ